MLRNSLLLQIKRVRRNVWPAHPGTSRSAFYDVLFGLVLFAALVLRFPDGEYSYLLRAARGPSYRTSGTLSWITLLTSLGFTSFLVGSPLRNAISYLFYHFVPRSWRSLKYRRLREGVKLEGNDVLVYASHLTSADIEHSRQSDSAPAVSPPATEQCGTAVDDPADLPSDANK
jgi:hypothetical protein